MKIALVGPSTGGAGKVLSNLGEGFKQLGHQTFNFQPVTKPLRTSPFIHPNLTLAAGFDNFVMKTNDWSTLVSFVRDKISTSKIKSWNDIDLVVARWPNGILNLQRIPIDLPIIIGLPDQNSFTGVCHYSGDCQNFKNNCDSCPAVRNIFKTMPKRNLDRKLATYQKFKKIGFVAPSEWIYANAMQSQINVYPIEQIRNPIANDFFTTPLSRHFDLNDRPLSVGFIASNVFDPVKGFSDVLQELLDLINDGIINLSVAGAIERSKVKKYPQIKFLGSLAKNELIKFYDSIDILIMPSREEAAGMVLVEAMARGVMPLVKPTGGLIDTLNIKNGFMFESPSELSKLICNIKRSKIEAKSLNAFESAKMFKPKHSAEKYLDFFNFLFGL